jgi:hypothetical protein
MGAFENALDQLAALAVPGMAQHYGHGALPDRIARGHLPALLVIPGDYGAGGASWFGSRAVGFEAGGFTQAAGTLTVAVTHLLVTSLAQDGIGMRAHYPRIVALMDAYFAALAGDPLLGGALREPARVAAEPGIVRYASDACYGAAFRHVWVLRC